MNADSPADGRRGEWRGKGGRQGGRECWGGERGGVSDRLSGCTGISSTQRHMILRSEVILADEYRGSVSSTLTKEKGVVFTRRGWKVCFRNPSCQQQTVKLSHCRGVTRVHKYYPSPFFSFFTASLACQNVERRRPMLLIQQHNHTAVGRWLQYATCIWWLNALLSRRLFVYTSNLIWYMCNSSNSLRCSL